MQHILPAQSDPTQSSPFVLFVEHAEVDARGYWRPQAQARLSSGLRVSGLLHALPAEELKSLLWVLSFVTPDGTCSPALSQLAEAMHVSPGKARSRLERLVAWRWQGQPVLVHSRAESGLEFYAPLPLIAARSEAAPPDRNGTPLPVQGGSRTAVIAHTRTMYARPRAEVEREINRQYRHAGTEYHVGAQQIAQTTESSELAEPTELVTAEALERTGVRGQLQGVGLTTEQAEALLSRYDLLRIRRQLAWLPYHSVRNKAGFLLAAIKDDYEAPRALFRATASPTTAPDAVSSSDAISSSVDIADDEQR